MPRFFVDAPLASGMQLALPEPVVRHVQVLRLQAGDALTVFNGDGTAFSATLTDIGKRHATVEIDAAQPADGSDPPYRIELIQGIASNEKMDWLIEKSVELGVDRIVPVTAARSVVRLSGERLLKRHTHWQALVRAACEQCGRNRVPEVTVPQEMDRWLDHAPDRAAPPSTTDTPLQLLLSPRASVRFDALPATAPAAGTRLLIGPEGGWSDEEEQRARDAGYLALSLGPRVLRTETAGMALLAALASRWGGW